MSKANILGKATEYIRFVFVRSYLNISNNTSRRVLKRREARLKREQAGLKSLISGLVNGPALLQAWEVQWGELFGGEEKDEVEDEPGSDEEDVEVDGEGEEDEEDSGRARKRARTVKTVKPVKVPSVLPATPKATTVTTTPTVLSEKRKRGRPRKIPLPAPGTPVTVNPTSQSPQQYLLAAFAFLSFLNSPLTTSSAPYSYSHPHEHTGSVLNHAVAGKPSGYGWDNLIQAFHLFVSAALFFSVVVPWLPQALRNSRFIAKLASPFIAAYPTHQAMTLSTTPALLEESQEAKQPSANMDLTRSALLNALSPVSRGSDAEAQMLRKALGISVGLVGLCQGVSKAGKKHRGIELDQLEQRAWVRLGELVALDGTNQQVFNLFSILMSCR